MSARPGALRGLGDPVRSAWMGSPLPLALVTRSMETPARRLCSWRGYANFLTSLRML